MRDSEAKPNIAFSVSALFRILTKVISILGDFWQGFMFFIGPYAPGLLIIGHIPFPYCGRL